LRADDELLLSRRTAAFGAGAPLFYDEPLHLVRGEGVYVFDRAGRRYVDLYNNVPCVGHCHPMVTVAIARQISTLNIHSRYLHEGAIELAERLVALHAPQIETMLFTCSATEANEVALRMARFLTGRRGIVCTNKTYHGNSELVSRLSLVGTVQPESEEVHAFAFPDSYRPIRSGLSEDELCEAYLEGLEDAIKRFESSGVGFAGLIMCSIFANEGLPDIPAGFMQRATELVHRAGGIVIADEVQAGHARTGQWWGYQTSQYAPDIVVMGKPMGNGVPLAATGTSRSIMEMFRSRTRYFNTFACSPLQAAAGLAVLDVIEGDGLLAHVQSVGRKMKLALKQRSDASARIGDVRGCGLFLGVEMIKPGGARTPDPDVAVKLSNRLKDLGFLTANAGAYRNMVKIRPPLVFTQDHAEQFLKAWDTAVADIDG
jgi:4-aminobutyrate aminotransferase-like enzyme